MSALLSKPAADTAVNLMLYRIAELDVPEAKTFLAQPESVATMTSVREQHPRIWDEFVLEARSLMGCAP